ncbi:cell envelope biogenesis protein TolA [Sphingomonas turrisvirgatae]|uniref:cell envelope biogenesis protein TolA n=1 Tax=Sphingomonas turrisvirgatae TaxID=1888892 RepID=UPI000AD7F0D2|nr:cell envelope biogenesis protein TolA [Sphingomonas turrisvirgatae]
MAVAIDRREGTALGVAVVGHIVLFGLLSVGFLATPNPLKLEPTPIEISLTDEASLQSEAPQIQKEAPAEKLAEEPGPVEPETPPPAPQPDPQPVARPEPTPPQPVAQPEPRPQPKPVPKAQPQPKPPAPKAQSKAQPQPKAAPAQPKAQPKTASQSKSPAPSTNRVARPTGRLTGIVDGLTDQPSKGKATTPPATAIGAQVKSALAAEVIRQLRPHWKAPTGADVELLRTQVEIRLNKDGTLAAPPRVIGQTGVTDSNRPQADLHKERAISAAKLAAPFKLPAEYYEAWKLITPTFDRRL